jgi:hypothetical protein
LSTSRNKSPLDAALLKIPAQFRSRILASYLEIKERFAKSAFDSEFDTAGLSAGKFCEAVLRFLQNALTGTSIPFGTHIQNYADECRKLIILPAAAGAESLRVIIPRALVFLYTLRGKRGIGHVGGDVEANAIDAATIVRIADWVLCELVRLFHEIPLEHAQAIVDTLSTRNIPEIWEVGGKKRILRNDLTFKQQVLVMTYSDIQGGVLTDDLFAWTQYSSLSMFKKSVLEPLHDKKLIEYDEDADIVYISPLGVQQVEEHILRPTVKS